MLAKVSVVKELIILGTQYSVDYIPQSMFLQSLSAVSLVLVRRDCLRNSVNSKPLVCGGARMVKTLEEVGASIWGRFICPAGQCASPLNRERSSRGRKELKRYVSEAK